MSFGYPAETAYLREFANCDFGAIGFSPDAEAQMLSSAICWSDVHQAICHGVVIWSDKDDASLTSSVIEGANCDGEELRIRMDWDFSLARLLVLTVERV